MPCVSALFPGTCLSDGAPDVQPFRVHILSHACVHGVAPLYVRACAAVPFHASTPCKEDGQVQHGAARIKSVGNTAAKGKTAAQA